MSDSSSLKVGTFGGTLLSILAAMTWKELGDTVLSACIGATVSFLVSLLLKKIIDYGKEIIGTSKTKRRI